MRNCGERRTARVEIWAGGSGSPGWAGLDEAGRVPGARAGRDGRAPTRLMTTSSPSPAIPSTSSPPTALTYTGHTLVPNERRVPTRVKHAPHRPGNGFRPHQGDQQPSLGGTRQGRLLSGWNVSSAPARDLVNLIKAVSLLFVCVCVGLFVCVFVCWAGTCTRPGRTATSGSTMPICRLTPPSSPS